MSGNPSPDMFKNELGQVPLYLKEFCVTVDYAAGFRLDEDHRGVVKDAIGELQTALRLGFFAWHFFGARQSASLDTYWPTDRRLMIRGSFEGIHHNVVVAVTRLVAALHHTPLATMDHLRAALDDADFAELPPRTIFAETVAGVSYSDFHGADGRWVPKGDFASYSDDPEIRRPRVGAEIFDDIATMDGTTALFISGAPFAEHAIDVIGTTFDQLAASGCFTPLGAMDDDLETGAEILFQTDGGGLDDALVLEAYGPETYGLLELLNCASGGSVETLSVSRQE